MTDERPAGILVAAGADRHDRERSVFGVMPFTVKVTSADTGGGCLVIEQANDFRGGPPRHVHASQDEWFYVVEGSYMVEVGGRLHHLGVGDSILAPRGVPHGWALMGPGTGRMVIAFTPAGAMEAFFDEASARSDMGSPEPMAELFARHDMRVVGPPLDVDRS